MFSLNRGRLDILTKLAKFLLVGGSGVIVNSVVLFALYNLVGLHLAAASVLTVETAVVNNYLWNNWWTFGRRIFSMVGLAKFNLGSPSAWP